jgi:cysteinyl-tRNA synthetase
VLQTAVSGCGKIMVENNLSQVKSYAYILQQEKLAKDKSEFIEILSKSERDMFVIDPFYYDNYKIRRWQKHELQLIKSGKTFRPVIAYLSIGEAENYRNYWQKSWDSNNDGKPDKSAPSFLCSENKNWSGNYKVKYWKTKWQDIVLKEIENIAEQGFDGIWLDIVDAFEFFEKSGDKYIDNKINPETGNTFRMDMVIFIDRIKNKSNSFAGTSLMIIPQNGVQLLEFPEYIKNINALAIENLFTDSNKLQSKSHTNYIMHYIKVARQSDLPVFLTEYPEGRKIRKYLKSKVQNSFFIPLITDRDLTGTDLK